MEAPSLMFERDTMCGILSQALDDLHHQSSSRSVDYVDRRTGCREQEQKLCWTRRSMTMIYRRLQFH